MRTLIALAIGLLLTGVTFGADIRKAYYERQCDGMTMWLADSHVDQRADGWAKPFCVNGSSVRAM